MSRLLLPRRLSGGCLGLGLRFRLGLVLAQEVFCQPFGQGDQGQDGGPVQGLGKAARVTDVEPFDRAFLMFSTSLSSKNLRFFPLSAISP